MLLLSLSSVDGFSSSKNREIEYLQNTNIDYLDGHDFEKWCAILLKRYGYNNVSLTPGSGDQGVDILAYKDGKKIAIQCKRYRKTLGNKPVQEVNTGKSIYKCDVAIVMTNSTFSTGGKKAAEATGVLLWDRSVIKKILNEVIKKEKRESNSSSSISKVLYPIYFVFLIFVFLGFFFALKYANFSNNNSNNIKLKKETVQTNQSTVKANNTIKPNNTKKPIIKLRIKDESITTVSDLRFGMTQKEVNNYFMSKYNTTVEKSSKKDISNYFTYNIISPNSSPVQNNGLYVCQQDLVCPENYIYLNNRIHIIHLYYLFDAEKGLISHEPEHMYLYALKYSILTDDPGTVFSSLSSEIELACGACMFNSNDTTIIDNALGISEQENDFKYRIWKQKNEKSIIVLSGKNLDNTSHDEIEEIEISFISYQTEALINNALENLKELKSK